MVHVGKYTSPMDPIWAIKHGDFPLTCSFFFEDVSPITPQKSNELIPKMTPPFLKRVTFSKAHHLGALQPLVFGG